MRTERVGFPRRQALGTTLGIGLGAFRAHVEVLASEKEDFAYQNKELERQHSREAIFFAFDTGNSEYLAKVRKPFFFNWTGYQDSTWAYSPLGDKDAVDLFRDGMSLGKTKSLFWKETSEGVRVIVQDLALPMSSFPSQAAFVELERV